MTGRVFIVHDRWRPHPLAWIHRLEARSIAGELAAAGVDARLLRFDAGTVARMAGERLLLRLSDPVMLQAAHALTDASIRYMGPRAAVMERCYDKYEASRIASAAGVASPRTALGCDAAPETFPAILKPRRGSDSIGVRILRRGPVPPRARDDRHIVQPLVHGSEITIGVLQGTVGDPLRILLPQGVPFSFARKYILRPRMVPLDDARLAARVRDAAGLVARTFEVGWAARIDFICETTSDTLFFLECDVAPLLGARSAFAASLAAAGVGRTLQLRLILE